MIEDLGDVFMYGLESCGECGNVWHKRPIPIECPFCEWHRNYERETPMTELVYCTSCGTVRALLYPPVGCHACGKPASLPVVLTSGPTSADGLKFGSGGPA